MRILHLDLSAGVAGDMLNAALFGLHEDRPCLEKTVAALNLPGLAVRLDPVVRSGLSAWTFRVEHPREHHHRHLSDILRILEASRLPEPVRTTAAKAFRLLAEAEAKVHGTSVEEVHFHEVGGLDAVCDIVCAAASLHRLGAERVTASAFTLETGGTAASGHGPIPVPVPAVMELVRDKPVRFRDIRTEITTPTGAAIVAAVTETFEPTDPWVPEKTAYGAGTKEIPVPNLLRAVLGRSAETADRTLLVETNLDDIDPRLIPETIAGLLTAGCLDAWASTVQMKKGRPGWLISCLLPEPLLPRVRDLLLTSTPTIGLRWHAVERACLPRRIESRETPIGPVRFKVVTLPDGTERASPEFEDLREAARRLSLPLHEVLRRL